MQSENLSPAKKFFMSKWVWLILVVDIIAVVFIATVSINKAAETAVVSFNVAPVNATITVNGHGEYNNNGEAYYFKPGAYEVQISHPDMSTKTFSVNLESNHNVVVNTFLSNEGDFHYYTLKNNSGSFYRLTTIASAQNNQTIDHDTSAEEFIAKQEQKNSIDRLMPIRFAICEGPATRVNCDAVEVLYNYSEQCDNQKCLIIKGRKEEITKNVIDKVTSNLASQGYNLNDYRYIYEQDTEI